VKKNVDAETSIVFSANGLVSESLANLCTDNSSTTITLLEEDVEPDYPDFSLVKNGEIGEDRSFKVDVVAGANAFIAAGDFTVSYDKEQIVCSSVEVNKVVTGAGAYVITKETTDEGSVIFSYVKTEPFADEKILITLTFQPVGVFFGDTTISVSGKDVVNASWKDIVLEYIPYTCTFPKSVTSIQGTENYNVQADDEAFVLDVVCNNIDEDAGLQYSSRDEKLVTVDADGKVSIVGAGSTIIDIQSPETTHFKGASFEVAITVEGISIEAMGAALEYSSITHDGSAKKPAVTIEGLTEGTDFTVSYEDNVEVGTATAVIKGCGKYTGELKTSFELVHTYGDWIIDEEPTCTKVGSKHKECACGDTVTEEIPAKGHTWEEEYTVDKKATYKEAGSKSIHCAVCDVIKEGSEVEIPMLRINPFIDVKKGDFYYDAVMWAVAEGITTGLSKTEFGPMEGCTRSQVVTFLWRAGGEPKVTAKNPFVDVPKGMYYYEPVLWAVKNAITTGVSATEFKPDDICTRGQIVCFLWRTAGEPAAKGKNPFVDVKKSDYYYDAVMWAVDQGITNGMSPTEFKPSDVCTRGQIVTFLYRFYN